MSIDCILTRRVFSDFIASSRLLAPAFAKEMDALLQYLPRLQPEDDEHSVAQESAELQLCLFSATFPYKTRAAARRLFRGRTPVVIDAAGSRTASLQEPSQENASLPQEGGRGNPGRYAGGKVAGAVQQKAISVDRRERTMLLRHLAETEGWDRILVFVASQYATEHVAKKLAAKGLRAAVFFVLSYSRVGGFQPGGVRMREIVDALNGMREVA